MHVARDQELRSPLERRSVVTIGVFDGLHLGHQKIIEQVRFVARQRDALAAVVTFDPHPALVLAPESAPLLLATVPQRLAGLAALEVDVVRVLTFNEVLAHESADSFVQRVLVDELRSCHVIVGEDFRFGHDRAGDVALLARYGARHDFDVHPAPIYAGQQRWSSTAVRRALGANDVAGANAILGRPFTLRGLVGHGDARGATLGYPTANVTAPERQQLPGLGIYAGAVRTVDGRWWPAALSVGTRPQFYDKGAVLVEAHLVGYHGDLYDTSVDVAFLARLRGETRFASVAELITQIDRDVVQTLEIFPHFSPQSSALLG